MHLSDFSHCMEKLPRTKPSLVFPLKGSSAVRLIHNVLTPTECSSLIQNVEAVGLTAPQLFDKSIRDCQRRHTLDIAMSEEIMPRLRPFLPEVMIVDSVRWKLSRLTHHWRYVKYVKGGKFAPHWDGAKLLPNYKMTMLTVQVYLNDDFEGGSTRFYMDYQAEQKSSHDIAYGSGQVAITSDPTHAVIPRVGSVLVFDHASRSVLHDGQPVECGVKYIMRCDVLYEVIAEDVPHIALSAGLGLCHTYCPMTAQRLGTRNYIGQVWICWCALDSLGSCSDCSVNQQEEINNHLFQSRKFITDPDSNRPAVAREGCCANDESRDQTATISFAPDALWRGNRRFIVDAEKAIILFTGKRASGKDFVAAMLASHLQGVENIAVYSTALGKINKRIYAIDNGLDYERLLVDRLYKEEHRVAMVKSHAARDAVNPEWCSGAVVQEFQQSGAAVLIVSDVRRLADLRYFQRIAKEKSYVCITLRIDCSDEARSLRGWRSDDVTDSLLTETELDGSSVNWSACIDNSDHSASGNNILMEWIQFTVLPRLFA